MFEQIFIALTGSTAIWLTQDRRSTYRKWACIFGLAGQPFWFISSYRAEQWGILFLTFIFTCAWARGFKNNWIDKEKS